MAWTQKVTLTKSPKCPFVADPDPPTPFGVTSACEALPVPVSHWGPKLKILEGGGVVKQRRPHVDLFFFAFFITLVLESLRKANLTSKLFPPVSIIRSKSFFKYIRCEHDSKLISAIPSMLFA